MWGFGSTLSGVVNTILAKIEGRQNIQGSGNIPNQPSAMQANINLPQMNQNTMVNLKKCILKKLLKLKK